MKSAFSIEPASRLARAGASLARVIRRPAGKTPDQTQHVTYPLSLSHIAKPWQRPLFNADWLGQYTPPWVMFWVLKLMREDPQISLGMGAVKSVFFGIDYRFEGGDASARAFLNHTIIESPWFDHLLLSLLNALDFGFQSHEILWDVGPVTFQPDVDAAEPVTIENANVVRGFVDLDPEEIAAINVDKFRNLESISLSGALQQSDIPGEKLLHAVHMYEFGNLWGSSMLRRAYNPWLWCNHIYGWLMRYLEGKANPPYVGTAPPDANLFDPNQTLANQVSKNPLEVLGAQMLALRGGGAAALPWMPDERGNNKWSIKVLEDSGRTEQFVTSLNHIQALKLRALYLPDRAATQDTATGSFAMADAHIELFLSILEGIKRHVVLHALTDLGHRILRANFPRSISKPQAAASDLSRQKHDLMADLVKRALAVPMTLDDGREYSGADLIDWNKTLTSLNVPHRKPHEAAHKPLPIPPAARPSAPPPPGGGFPPKKTIGFEEDDAAPPTPARAARESSSSREGPIHIHIEQPKPPAQPSVNVIVPERKVDVHNVISVPERKVEVRNQLAVPERTVNVDVNVQGGSKRIEFTTDKKGLITGADVTPEE